MTLKTWSAFSKRINSTKQPTSGSDLAVKLKEGTSITNPVFICSSVGTGVNYVYASDWGRYYFVTDAVQVTADFVELHCAVDVLATYKSQVGSYSGLVEYTSSSTKKYLNDPRNNPTDLVTITGTSVPLTGVSFNNVGGYILGVLGDGATGASGVVDYYALTQAQMVQLAQDLYTNTIFDEIKNQFTNATNSLVSCIWLPLTGIGSGSYPLHIGRQNFPNLQSCSKVIDRIVTFTSGAVTVNFSAISGGAGANMTYLEKAPYATGELFLPFIGWVPLDLDIVSYTKNIELDGYIDILTGDIVYKVRYGGAFVATFNGNIATKVPLSGASYDGVGVAAGSLTAIGGVVATIASIATHGSFSAIAAGVGAAAGGAFGAAKSAELHTMINGGNSSAIGVRLGTDAYIQIHQYAPAEPNLLSYQSEQGMPYFEVATISSLSGFVKCAAASVSIPGTQSEKDALNSYLNGGFYYE